MPELDDHELLAEFARGKSESAFATLVARYVNLVYSAALRFTRNPHHAEEITQAVFIILAQKAGSLRRGVVLSGWLYQAARLTAANFVKGEIRRQRREQEAYMQSTLNEPDAVAWEQIAPLLDEAMGGLGETDRNAVVLRFFENKTAAEVGVALKLSEAAAHKRTARALEKLRTFLCKQGVTLSAVAIAGAVSAHSVQAAPVALAGTITATVASGTTATTSTLTLVKGALKLMAWTKAKMAAAIGVAAILAAGTTTITIKEINNRSGYYKGKPLREWLATLDDQHPGPAFDEAAEAVRHIGTRGLPAIISMLKIEDPMHRQAVLACYELGPKAKPAMSPLVKLLDDGFAQGYVGAALDKIGPDAIPSLTQMLTNKSDHVRLESASALGNMSAYWGKAAILKSDAVPALVAASLGDDSPVVRNLAARSLTQIGYEKPK